MVSHQWDFGDGSQGTGSHPVHGYSSSGVFFWQVISSVNGPSSQASVTNSGSLFISAPPVVTAGPVSQGALTLSWPGSDASALLEQSTSLGPDAVWTPSPTVPVFSGSKVTATLPVPSAGAVFYRLRHL